MLGYRPSTCLEKGPLAPAGQRNPDPVDTCCDGDPVGHSSKALWASPLLAVPCACSFAELCVMSVAGSVDA